MKVFERLVTLMIGLFLPLFAFADGPGRMGEGMMGGNMMGWDHMRGYYSGLTPEQMKQRQYMMDRYMPMQQMMMDHMLWHQRWQSTPPAAPETK